MSHNIIFRRRSASFALYGVQTIGSEIQFAFMVPVARLTCSKFSDTELLLLNRSMARSERNQLFSIFVGAYLRSFSREPRLPYE